jgi:hypothetical protein
MSVGPIDLSPRRAPRLLLRQLLEQQPFADADDSLFEEEEYDSVSALLGERAKPFLGIPVGPLQVGHFVGALAIILMAFVDYPGFPLTSFPTPVRDALQGGECRNKRYERFVLGCMLCRFRAAFCDVLSTHFTPSCGL